MQLSNRLKTIADLVNPDDKVADVGCDHGLLAIYLIQQQRASQVVVSDINQAALANAQSNINKYQLQTKIPTILSDGIQWIVNYPQINCVIIAGLGTYKILMILKNDLSNVKRYLIQSTTNLDKIREWIKTNNFYLETEILVKENDHIYEIIVINKIMGYEVKNDNDIIFGVRLAQDYPVLFNEKWRQKCEHYQKIIKKIAVEPEPQLTKLITLISNKINQNSYKGSNDDLRKRFKK